jgi:hypothetical protein
MKRNSKQKLWTECMRLWSRIVLTRDGHKCQAKVKHKCQGKIDPHHIISRRYKATALMPSNGVALCRSIHEKTIDLDKRCLNIIGAQTYLELWSIAQRGRTWHEWELAETKESLKQELERMKG